MDTIVDGYNLIFSCGWHAKGNHSMALEKSRDRLIYELRQRIAEPSRLKVTIVFDAKSSPIKETQRDSQVNGFRVVYADGFADADSMIEEMIRTHSAPKSLLVVSDDNRIKTAATKRKSKSIGCDAWLDQLEAVKDDLNDRSADEKRIDSLESTDWIAEFGIDEATLNELGDSDKPAYNPFPPGYGETD